MTNRAAAILSSTLLARKGAAMPTGYSAIGVRDGSIATTSWHPVGGATGGGASQPAAGREGAASEP